MYTRMRVRMRCVMLEPHALFEPVLAGGFGQTPAGCDPARWAFEYLGSAPVRAMGLWARTGRIARSTRATLLCRTPRT